MSDRGPDLQQKSVSIFNPHLRCMLASVQASRCFLQGQPITPDVLKLYQLSFDSYLLSCRLKFASMLYCSGKYEAAENCLTYCEGLLGPSVYHHCACPARLHLKPKSMFLENALNQYETDILTKHICNCFHFTRHETRCIPEFLLYEMSKTISEVDRQQRQPASYFGWMDLVVVDCEPFLHYLQFLTNRQLGQHDRAFETYLKFPKYVIKSSYHGHVDTTLNMQGHCCELLDWLDHAWICYGESLQLYPRNNAANWHVARLMHQRINY